MTYAQPSQPASQPAHTPPAYRRASGGDITKGYCPAFTRTVPEKAAYKNAANLQRLQQLFEMAGELESTEAYTLAASLAYAGQQRLESGDVATDTWTGEARPTRSDWSPFPGQAP